MSRCEDFPCCGHGPPPLGDGGGCPTVVTRGSGTCEECGGSGRYDEELCDTCGGSGRIELEVTLWNCVGCGVLFEPTSSSLCAECYYTDEDDHLEGELHDDY